VARCARPITSTHARPDESLPDAFFLPIAGFTGVQRPGPTVWIFKRRDAR
jgi:hypothetical protein